MERADLLVSLQRQTTELQRVNRLKDDFFSALCHEQAEGGTTRGYGGLGLELTIVRYLVELHGGTIVALSPGLGQGAAFTVTLLQQQSQGAGAQGRSTNQSPTNQSPTNQSPTNQQTLPNHTSAPPHRHSSPAFAFCCWTMSQTTLP